MPVVNTQINETTTITENGTYDVARYTTAVVNTPVAPANYAGYSVSSSGALSKGGCFIDFSTVKSVGHTMLKYVFADDKTAMSMPDFSHITTFNPYCMEHCFYRCTNLSGVASFDSVTYDHYQSSSLVYCFAETKITELRFPNLTFSDSQSFMQNCCEKCKQLTTVYFPKLKQLGNSQMFYNAFAECTSLSVVNFDALQYCNSGSGQIFYYAFMGCTSLTSVSFYSLEEITVIYCFCYAFQDCTNLANLYFPALTTGSFGVNYTNQFQNIVKGVTGCVLHFPKNLDPQTGDTTISSLSGYPNFGGTNTVLSFDLPATKILTGANAKTYRRNPRFDTTSVLGWYNTSVGMGTPYYTSGLTDPTVGTTIYSDAGCTTAVTTVSSIA